MGEKEGGGSHGEPTDGGRGGGAVPSQFIPYYRGAKPKVT